MSTYKTGIEIDSEVHSYLFQAKEKPGETFNAALRRELGLPAPDADSGDSDESEAIEAD
jgi:negative regulator of replication initiation